MVLPVSAYDDKKNESSKKDHLRRGGSNNHTMNNTMSFLFASVIGVAVGLMLLNVFNTGSCEKGSANELERHAEALQHRLKKAERLVLESKSLLDSLVRTLQTKLVKLSPAELEGIERLSNDEAVRLALVLEKYPASPMPYFETDYSGSAYGGGSSSSWSYGSTEGKSGDSSTDKFSNNYGSSGFSIDDDKGLKKGDDKDNYFNSTADGMDTAASQRKQLDDDFYLKSDRGNSKDGTEKSGAAKLDDDALSAKTLTDSESTKQCGEWRTDYSVIPGVSWGSLPFDLQKKWLEYSCDYHLSD